MLRKKMLGACLLPTTLFFQQCYSIEVTSLSEPGGPAASALALIIVDGTDVTLGTAPATFTGDGRAIGSFTSGITPAGTLLPLQNQNAGGDAQYSGGIGIDSGVCLCTGLINDDEVVSPVGRGVGVQGPNNGAPISGLPANEGEISIEMNQPVDLDFEAEVFPGGSSNGGDATILEFTVETEAPGYLRISFVHASDEFPAWTTDEFNDTTTIFVDGENIVLFRNSESGQVVESPLKLSDLDDCGPLFFMNNQIAPAPANMFPTEHQISAATTYFDHEFAGFSKVLTLETKCVLAKGTHTVKIVIQDVGDYRVDSGVFIEENSLKLYSFYAADFDLDGDVDADDFLIAQQNMGNQNAKFTDGDANGDGIVDGTDISTLFGAWGLTGGNKNFCADFDRDGDVDGFDFFIWQRNNGLSKCASRFEGDADQDGEVNGDDLAIWSLEHGGTPSGLCGCSGGTQNAQANTGSGATPSATEFSETGESSTPKIKPHPADTDDDGDFDLADLSYWVEFYNSQE